MKKNLFSEEVLIYFLYLFLSLSLFLYFSFWVFVFILVQQLCRFAAGLQH